MDSQSIRTGGAALADARRSDAPATSVPAIADADEAYAMQAAANAAFGGARIGYKVGATSLEAQKIVGCDGPFFGPMVASDAHADGAAVPWREQFRAVECEFAFRFARAFPAPGAAPDMDALLAAIATCHPALEVVARRTPGPGLPKAPAIIADFAAHGAFVEGPAAENWRGLDLAEVAVAGLFDGEITNRGSGAAVLGHPFNSLLWLAGELAARGERIEAGEIVTTGTTLGIVKAAPGTEVAGDFGPIGRVSLKFSAA